MLMRPSTLQPTLKLSATWFSVLMAPLMASPLLAADATLVLPDRATVGVEFTENVIIAEGEDRKDNILLRPNHDVEASHQLPEYCVIIGDAMRSGDRVRITAHDVTCIEAEDADSAIFSDEMDGGVYDTDGQYGLACEDSTCTFLPNEGFMLTLNETLEIDAQDNPSAEINAQRRQEGQEESEEGQTDEE